MDIKQKIESVINNLNELPSIPEVTSKIINMVNDPEVSFKKVADEISKNQSITTNLLKLSNSAFFSKGKEITSIDRAIVTLGLKEVKNIVLLVTAKPILEREVIGYDLEKGALWEHGLAVATASRKISLLIKRKDISDVVFTGGLIHNVGKVVLAIYVQSVFKEILNAVEAKKIPFYMAERDIMGYDHQEVGERILAKWNFPPVLKSIVKYYLEPELAPAEHALEVSIVHISNALCLMAGVGIGSDGLYQEYSRFAMGKVKLSDQDIVTLYSEVPEILNEIKNLK